MANSPSPASSSRLPRSRPASIDDRAHSPTSSSDIPVEVLVEHLLAAKRSLSSITLVLRANDLTTHARRLHEEAVVLSAQTAFLRRGVGEQVRILLRLRRGMARAYEAGRREFRGLLRTLDAADGRLEGTLATLRGTVVESIFRPEGEEPKSLIDFVDENSVDRVRDALKESVAELQAAETSFDGDLLRFDNDLRALNKAMSPSASDPTSDTPSDLAAYQPIPHLLASLTTHSHAMAEHLSSLTRHFDMCVTAVRATEGGAALALRKAADEVTHADGGGEAVSISGVMAERETRGGLGSSDADLDPRERAEVAQVVVQDAPEVDEVVAELEAAVRRVEADFCALRGRADRVRAAHSRTAAAFRALDDVGSRLRGYAAAEAEHAQRREAERGAVAGALGEMEQLRLFYEGYVGAYESLTLEVERRRLVEEKIRGILRKARDGVHRLVEADRREREVFRQEIGDFLPTDLWVGMDGPLQRWDLVPVDDAAEAGGSKPGLGDDPGLDRRGEADTARERFGRGKGKGKGVESR